MNHHALLRGRGSGGKLRRMKAASAKSTRIKRLLRAVDDMNLSSDEIDIVCEELNARKGCTVDLSECRNDEEREIALLLKDRFDAMESGRVRTISLPDLLKGMRQEARSTNTQRAPRRAKAS